MFNFTCPDCGAQCTFGGTRYPTIEHEPTCPAWLVKKAVSERDRAWFKDHPEASEYHRPLLPGDLGVPVSLEGLVLGSASGRPLKTRVTRLPDDFIHRAWPADLVINPMSLWGEFLVHKIAAAQGGNRFQF